MTVNNSLPVGAFPAVPPAHGLWKRYSPHNELPLSSAGSLVIHAVVFAGLLLAGSLAAFFGLRQQDMPAQLEIVQPPDGLPQADRKPAGAEQREEAAGARIPVLAGHQPDVKVGELPHVSKDQGVPIPKELIRKDGDRASVDELKALETSAGEKLIARMTPPKGPKKPGADIGDGPNGVPGGSPNRLQEERRRRWTMIFDTIDGRDYLRQLDALGAILAVPDGERFRVVRDPRREVRAGGVVQLDRLYWIDDNPKSVAGLATALRLDPPPARFVAFFPPELETRLLDAELRYLKNRTGQKDEQAIKETYFHLRKQGVSYVPVVVKQQHQ